MFSGFSERPFRIYIAVNLIWAELAFIMMRGGTGHLIKEGSIAFAILVAEVYPA